MEVLGVTICTSVERQIVGDTQRRANWSSYWALCFFLLISSATSNIALNYINYPTKVVFRSCKLIPTMVIAVVYNRKKIQGYEFALGACVSLGMVLFAVADFNVSPNFNFLGLFLVCGSVVADAFLPNFQERLFEQGSKYIVTHIRRHAMINDHILRGPILHLFLIPLSNVLSHAQN